MAGDYFDDRFNRIFIRNPYPLDTFSMRSCAPVSACISSTSVVSCVSPDDPKLYGSLGAAVAELEKGIAELRTKVAPVLRPWPCGSTTKDDSSTKSPMRELSHRLYALVDDLRQTTNAIDL